MAMLRVAVIVGAQLLCAVVSNARELEGYASCYGNYEDLHDWKGGCGYGGNYITGENFKRTTALCQGWDRCGMCFKVKCSEGKSTNAGCSNNVEYVRVIDQLAGESCGDQKEDWIFDLSSHPFNSIATENGNPSMCSGKVYVKYEAVDCNADEVGIVTGGVKVNIMPGGHTDPYCPEWFIANVGGAGALYSVEASHDGGNTWFPYQKVAGNIRWDCTSDTRSQAGGKWHGKKISFKMETCDLASLPEACTASGDVQTFLDLVPDNWCPGSDCSLGASWEAANGQNFKVSSQVITSTTSTTTAVAVTTTITATTTTATTAVQGSCTGEPCKMSECRSEHNLCGLGSDYCNEKSIWTSACGGGLPDTICTSEPCKVTECRSQHGFCGKGDTYCNKDSTWTESCGGGLPDTECTGEPCAAGECRSEHGYCGTGDAYCNSNAIWTSQCGGSSQCTGSACGQGQCRSAHGYCGAGPDYCNGQSTWTEACGGIVGSCDGNPCTTAGQCRSQHGWCGEGPSYCNAESLWSPACAEQQNGGRRLAITLV